MTYEGFRLKLAKVRRNLFSDIRNRKLINKKFTIISNNCWGGTIYESYNLQKQTPTVGLFFMAEDYIKFCSDLKHYTSEDIQFISPQSSRYVEILKKDKRFGLYPIGKIDDIEIFFLHYNSEDEAKEKWNRRCKRINWDKIIVKFNDQNGCCEEHVRAFAKMPYKNKLFFTIHDWPVDKWDGYFIIKQFTKDTFITASHEPFGKNRYIDITKMINDL